MTDFLVIDKKYVLFVNVPELALKEEVIEYDNIEYSERYGVKMLYNNIINNINFKIYNDDYFKIKLERYNNVIADNLEQSQLKSFSLNDWKKVVNFCVLNRIKPENTSLIDYEIEDKYFIDFDDDKLSDLCSSLEIDNFLCKFILGKNYENSFMYEHPLILPFLSTNIERFIFIISSLDFIDDNVDIIYDITWRYNEFETRSENKKKYPNTHYKKYFTERILQIEEYLNKYDDVLVKNLLLGRTFSVFETYIRDTLKVSVIKDKQCLERFLSQKQYAKRSIRISKFLSYDVLTPIIKELEDQTFHNIDKIVNLLEIIGIKTNSITDEDKKNYMKILIKRNKMTHFSEIDNNIDEVIKSLIAIEKKIVELIDPVVIDKLFYA